MIYRFLVKLSGFTYFPRSSYIGGLGTFVVIWVGAGAAYFYVFLGRCTELTRDLGTLYYFHSMRTSCRRYLHWIDLTVVYLPEWCGLGSSYDDFTSLSLLTRELP